MDNEQNLDYLSEDVQEILSTPPSWVMIWGTAGIILMIFIITMVGYLFKYPEVVAGRVELTTPLPPEPVVAPEMMQISEFLVKEGQMVELNEVLAIRENPAKMADIFDLEIDTKKLLLEKEALANFQPKSNLELGEISRDYYAFVNSFKKFTFEKKDDYNEQRMRELERKKDGKRMENSSLQERLKAAELDLKATEKNLRASQLEYSIADSMAQKFLRPVLQNASQAKINKQKEIAAIQEEIAKSYLEQSGITKEELQVQYESSSVEKETLENLIQNLQLLQSAIDIWKKKNLIRAPISGEITFFGQDLQSRVYQPNQEILSIIPNQESEQYVGIIRLPILKTVKLKTGQKVRLKFDRYPFQEWGFVVGEIGKMTPNQREETYIIQVDLPEGLTTNKEKNIPFQYQMRGKAEVITADKRFITRLLDKF